MRKWHRFNREKRERAESHDEQAETFSRYEKTRYKCHKVQDNDIQKQEEVKKKYELERWEGRISQRTVYLEINIQRNEDLITYIKERMRRANVVVKQLWRIGKRKLKDDFERRPIDYLVMWVMLLDWNFRMEGDGRIWKNTVKILKIVFRFWRMHSI